MVVTSLFLQNFRNYTDLKVDFSGGITIIVGNNTAGKTNFVDGLHLLSTGKSFVAEKDDELIHFGERFARIKGLVNDEAAADSLQLEVLIMGSAGTAKSGKRYLVNGVGKRRTDFMSHLPMLLFIPTDLEIVSDGPGYRRIFLDQVLEQTDEEYKRSLSTYQKSLRQRNALLEQTRKVGYRNRPQFEYWDNELISSGAVIQQKRAGFISFINDAHKIIIDCFLEYQQNIISEERLMQYQEAEAAAGMTLIGPQRDDMLIACHIHSTPILQKKEARLYASRGQQRLIVLQLKLLQLQYMQELLHTEPVLLLDDIFSELDASHIALVSRIIGKQQTIITTTHKEFISGNILKNAKVIKLERSQSDE